MVRSNRCDFVSKGRDARVYLLLLLQLEFRKAFELATGSLLGFMCWIFPFVNIDTSS